MCVYISDSHRGRQREGGCDFARLGGRERGFALHSSHASEITRARTRLLPVIFNYVIRYLNTLRELREGEGATASVYLYGYVYIYIYTGVYVYKFNHAKYKRKAGSSSFMKYGYICICIYNHDAGGDQ